MGGGWRVAGDCVGWGLVVGGCGGWRAAEGSESVLMANARMALGWWLLAAWLQAAGCWLVSAGCWLVVAVGWWLLVS